MQADEFGKTLDAKTEEAERRVVEKVGEIARARGVSMAQIALAWDLGKNKITAPVIGATKPHHLDDRWPIPEARPRRDALARRLYVPRTATGFV